MSFNEIGKVKIYFCFIISLLINLFLPTITYANFENGVKALNAGDYSNALVEARKAAAAGDSRSYDMLGFIFQHGLGVQADPKQAFYWYKKSVENGVVKDIPKVAISYYQGKVVAQDKEKALNMVREAAKKFDDPDSQFLVFLFLSLDYLNSEDDTGKRDEKKFQQLAARPVSERGLDIEANDSLYRSTNHGLSDRSMTLLNFLTRRSGKSNQQKLQTLLEKMAQNSKMVEEHKEILNYKALLEKVMALGETETRVC